MVTFDGKYQKISDEEFDFIGESNFGNSYFVIPTYNSSFATYLLALIQSDGTITQTSLKIDGHRFYPRISPNKHWFFIPNYNPTTDFYAENLQIIKSWDFYSDEIIWRPDSLGAFLFRETEIYYLPIPDDEPTLIEDCAPSSCSINNYVWLP